MIMKNRRLSATTTFALVLALAAACGNPPAPKTFEPTATQVSTPSPELLPETLTDLLIETLDPIKGDPITGVPAIGQPIATAIPQDNLIWRLSSPPDGLLDVGKEFSFTLDLDPGNNAISGIQLKLHYPAESFELVNITPGGILGPSPLVVNQPKRQAVFAMARRGETVAATVPGRVAVINMRTIQDLPKPGSVMIWLDRVKLTDGDFQTIGQDSVAWSLSGPG